MNRRKIPSRISVQHRWQFLVLVLRRQRPLVRRHTFWIAFVAVAIVTFLLWIAGWRPGDLNLQPSYSIPLSTLQTQQSLRPQEHHLQHHGLLNAENPIRRSPIKSLHQQQRPIGDEAWQQFLQEFRAAIDRPKFDLWLPVVIRGDGILCRREHIYQLAGYNRMDSFVQMMLYALQPIQAQMKQQQQQQKHDKLAIWKHDTIPLLMGIGDHHDCGGSLFPRFTWCSSPENDTCPTIAIPSFNLFLTRPDKSIRRSSSFDEGQHQELQRQHEQNQKSRYPWSKKRRQAVWRGAPTGNVATPDGGWASLPRAQLVNYSLAFPKLLDAAFVNMKQFQNLYPDQVPQLRQHSRFAKRIELNDFQMYRAVVDIDGNAWSSRFGELLCLNSVVLKVKPRNKNYFYDELRPWVHYIPVQADMSDLMDKIHIAIFNDTLAQSIVYHANKWCQTRLTRQSMAMDLFWIIDSYVELLGGHNEDDNVTRWRQWDIVWEDILHPKVQRHRPPVVAIQTRWSEIRYWSISWRMAKPIHALLQAGLDLNN